MPEHAASGAARVGAPDSAGLGAGARAALAAFDWQPRVDSPLRSLPEQLAEGIAADIHAGRWPPGAWIREQSLSTDHGVSRGPVREALRLLERDGLVLILPRRGAQVSALSAHELRNIFEIRAHLLYLAMQRLALRAEAGVVGQFRHAVRALAALVAEDGGGAAHADAYVDVSARLTLLMGEHCGNPQLCAILRSLARQTRRYTRLGLATPALRRASLRGWRRALRALEQGRADDAAEAARALVLHSCDMASAALEQQGAASRPPTDEPGGGTRT